LKEKVLVTGGAGYIGSILVDDLINNGYKVTVLDNFMYKQSSLNHLCKFDEFSVINNDVRNENLVKSLLEAHKIVIPLAAYVGAPLCSKDPVGARSVNHDAIEFMIKNLKNDHKIIMPTTNSAYGSGDDNNLCDEKTKLNPISNYAKDKVEIENKLLNLTSAVSLRLATVFGMSPRMRLDLLVNDFTYRAFHDRFVVLFESHFKRNYIHVRDVSRAIIHSLKNYESMKNNIYNVGLDSANISKKELCEKISEYIPDFYFTDGSDHKDPDQRNYIVSNEKIKKTGFKPNYSLDDGIIELIKGYNMIKNSQYGNI